MQVRAGRRVDAHPLLLPAYSGRGAARPARELLLR